MRNVMPQISLSGIPEFQAILAEAGPAVLQAGLQAMKQAAKPIIQNAKQRLTVGWGYGGGALKRSIGVLYGKVYRDRKRAVMKIGPRKGYVVAWTTERKFDGSLRRGRVRIKNRRHDPRMIAHLVEFGHRIAVGGRLNVKQPKSLSGRVSQALFGGPKQGAQAGTVKGFPFLRPAFDAHKLFAERLILSAMRTKLLSLRAKRAMQRQVQLNRSLANYQSQISTVAAWGGSV